MQQPWDCEKPTIGRRFEFQEQNEETLVKTIKKILNTINVTISYDDMTFIVILLNKLVQGVLKAR